MNIEERIGISTLWMPKDGKTDIFEALKRVKDKGFHTIEIVPIESEGLSGYPFTKRSIGFWLPDFDSKKREKLAKILESFELVTVHSPPVDDINIASVNRGIRDESIRQYLQVTNFAIEIGAEIVTFHPGHSSPGFIRDPREIERFNIDFAQILLEKYATYDIVFGYEVTTKVNFDHFCHIIEVVKNRKFGINLDVGHCLKVEGPKIEEWLSTFGKRIIEVHLHGAYQRSDYGIITHQPYYMNDNKLLNFRDIIKRLGKMNFRGPFILETLSNTLEKYLDDSVFAKREIVSLVDNSN